MNELYFIYTEVSIVSGIECLRPKMVAHPACVSEINKYALAGHYAEEDLQLGVAYFNICLAIHSN